MKLLIKKAQRGNEEAFIQISKIELFADVSTQMDTKTLPNLDNEMIK